jgi:methylated-DNA-[protein]-cysteine S-methyltransferase
LNASTARDEELAENVVERLVRYAAGEPVDFSDVPVSLDHLSAFQRRVVKACRAIPCGDRRTYGQLAAAAGSPGAARAVGQVMAGNRMPLVVPCHRVVASGGGLGGFSAPQGLAMKRRLLALEQEVVAADSLVN